MGGKKKKSAAQAATSVAPSAAAGRTGADAAGNGVAEEAKKQPASNTLAKPAKENKSKGGINLLGWCHRFRNITVCIQTGSDAALKLKKMLIWSILNSLILYSCYSVICMTCL